MFNHMGTATASGDARRTRTGENRAGALPAPISPAPEGIFPAQAAARAWHRDLLCVAGTLCVVLPIATWISQGGMAGMLASPGALITALGIVAGLGATGSVILMLWLAARVPFIEHTVGLDKALAAHRDLGEATVVGLVMHGALLIVGYALLDGVSWPAEIGALWSGDFALAVASLLLLGVVGVTSMWAVRKKLPHEAWWLIHLLTYVAVLAALPHQFSMGGTFASGWPRATWMALWGVTLAVLCWYRLFIPLRQAWLRRLTVTQVRAEAPGVVSIEMTGPGAADFMADHRAGAGQFGQWRFLAPGLWTHSHPLSLSAAPHGQTPLAQTQPGQGAPGQLLRVTVKARGRGTAQLIRRVRPGMHVTVQGPYGVFTEASRSEPDLVLVGFGVGIAPIRAFLETATFAPGHATVILRGSSLADMPHLAEIDAIARRRGARLYVLPGHRSRSIAAPAWAPESARGIRLVDLTGPLQHADLYICGPKPAAQSLENEAIAHGLPVTAVHREEFDW